MSSLNSLEKSQESDRRLDDDTSVDVHKGFQSQRPAPVDIEPGLFVVSWLKDLVVVTQRKCFVDINILKTKIIL
ncbi:hypothetical protein GUITHDRAFT_114399 [Guillardia theta CCMP2712]|uniref:Uncharacterized protein n=1 Tax=Guillardia theta (strain CCMP2712) TaxID=905079 RepID=L1IU60_GUITC|nr:hypothetical protein GUITHDRAFT_114399 [Guillardia theta CCMP2712]EKX39439.1 hypothetical protein GUITHDRAFT_114399 [Guillardia theta CCMP2712]|eukprot:XP_005826419.1 hypothetical protein GUITHDRAFT_114399 [Guillardia theta CCMP2712]